MKGLLLSTAVKNAGDFLITSRSEKLISCVWKGIHIDKWPIWESFDNRIEEINSYDAIFVPGGPTAIEEYPVCVPLCTNLTDITTPMIGTGLGWYGSSLTPKEVYSYRYSEKTLQYLHKLADKTGLACRDWYTVRTMKNCGVNSAIMTGCPAWYDLNYINDLQKRLNNSDIRTICVSDPASELNTVLLDELLEMLQQRYPNARITVVYHRGLKHNRYLERGIEVIDISDSSEGLRVYDSCDLHVGFRVHAHIYNLSRANRTILIEEDGRGAGVNDALGLRHISAYAIKTIEKRFDVVLSKVVDTRNHYAIKEVSDYLDTLEQTGFIDISLALEKIQYYYDVMINYLKKAESVI